MDMQRTMEAVAAGKSGAWGAFLDRVEILRREMPGAPGAEKLLALDLMHELREHLLRLGVKVIIPPSGAMMTDGLEPGGLLAFHPSQLVVEREEPTWSGPNAQEAFRRHMDRVRADRERFVKGCRKGVVSIEGKYDPPLHERYEAEDDDGRDMLGAPEQLLGVPAPGNYTAAVLRSPVSVPEQIIGLPVRDGRGRVVGEIKDARKEGDKCVVDVTLNAEGVALIEQTQRSGPFFNLDRGGRTDGKTEAELYESAGVGLPECGHLVPDALASHSPTGNVWAVGEKCPSCGSPSPELHPAMQWEGEVQPCNDAFHSKLRPCDLPTIRTNPAEEEPNPITVYNEGVKAASLPRIIAEDDGEP